MSSKILRITFILLPLILTSLICSNFTVSQLKEYKDNPHVIVIASTGRSGSTLLTEFVKKAVGNQTVLKNHLLPPKHVFRGKIIFIFSNPDKAAESVLHRILSEESWGYQHFNHMENSDHAWLELTNNANHQTEEYNLLAQDALRCFEHLEAWLHLRTEPSTCNEAQILALKYENLWEDDSINAINAFLNIDNFFLPPYRPRGVNIKNLFPLELNFRRIYNLGTDENPRYAAYDRAREVWEAAPPYQFLKIVNKE